jgi:hypothetical protein
VFRTVSLVDWQYRAETGSFRLRDPDEQAARMAMMFGGPAPGTQGRPSNSRSAGSDEDILEGEVLGEEYDDEDDEVEPGELPPGTNSG